MKKIASVVSIPKPKNVVQFQDLHAYIVCGQMREDEQLQYMVCTGATEYDPQEAARNFINCDGIKFTLVDDDGMPVVIGGYTQPGLGRWSSWMAGTDAGWGQHWVSITRAARWLMSELIRTGARRIETVALASRTKANEWHERSLGLKLEGVARKYGQNGEDLAVYAWVQED